MFDQNTLAGAFGMAGFILIALWPLARTRRVLLAGQAASAVAFAVHYLLIGATTGAAATFLSLLQAATAWPAGARPLWCRVAFAATLPALAALAWASWAGWPSAWATIGTVAASAARWHARPAMMRGLFALSALAWLAHDVSTNSIPGMLADLACCATLFYGWMRDRAGKHTPE
ncbi:MAG: YgjV family protein [Alphaproteobacteria bacterium]